MVLNNYLYCFHHQLVYMIVNNYHMIYTAQQIKVGPFILPNRFVMGSMHTGLEGDQDKFTQLA